MNNINIREIRQQDNPEIARIIRETLTEYGAPATGTAYADPELDRMFETYNVPDAVYYVIEDNQKVIGGAGVAQLKNGEQGICELQKMYFLPEARGRGLGRLMMAKCLEAAGNFGYRYCYLETLPGMEQALELYRKSGFKNLETPMGGTGHTSCSVWMARELIDNNQ